MEHETCKACGIGGIPMSPLQTYKVLPLYWTNCHESTRFHPPILTLIGLSHSKRL